jgi:hypothetical protein
MTEAEWLASTDPSRMLEFLRATGRTSSRKLRLCAAGLCRRIGYLLKDKRSRKALATVERFADGLATDRELRAAENAARAAFTKGEAGYIPRTPSTWDQDYVPARTAGYAAWAVGLAASDDPFRLLSASIPLGLSFVLIDRVAMARLTGAAGSRHGEEYREQADLLRCILGNPFRPVAVAPCCLAWNDGTVPKLAQAIYEERAFDRLPILADALEDAGCTDEAILSHCRGPGPHARGCWLVDLILGKS